MPETSAPPSTSNGGGDPAVQQWAGAFCRSYGTWVRDTKSLINGARSDVQTAPDLAAAKRRLLELYRGATGLAGTLIDEVDRLGPPPTPRGPDVHRTFLAGLRALRGRMADLSTKVAAADPSSPATFRREVAAAGSDFQSRLREITRTFSEIDTKYPDRQLGRAMASACSGIAP